MPQINITQANLTCSCGRRTMEHVNMFSQISTIKCENCKKEYAIKAMITEVKEQEPESFCSFCGDEAVSQMCNKCTLQE